jgi:hypothetical protein
MNTEGTDAADTTGFFSASGKKTSATQSFYPEAQAVPAPSVFECPCAMQTLPHHIADHFPTFAHPKNANASNGPQQPWPTRLP